MDGSFWTEVIDVGIGAVEEFKCGVGALRYRAVALWCDGAFDLRRWVSMDVTGDKILTGFVVLVAIDCVHARRRSLV
jgi:hypothetical protein